MILELHHGRFHTCFSTSGRSTPLRPWPFSQMNREPETSSDYMNNVNGLMMMFACFEISWARGTSASISNLVMSLIAGRRISFRFLQNETTTKKENDVANK